MDREKVIKGLECCQIGAIGCQTDCPYSHEESCKIKLINDAISLLKEQEELLRKLQKDKNKLCLEVSEWKHKFHDKSLKEQEAVEPIFEQDSMVCGVCGHEVIWQKMLGDGVWLDEQLDYCPKCGKKVKWE